MNLPAPPTDTERDSYFSRHIGLIVTWTFVGMTGIIFATLRMAISHPGLRFYILVALLAAIFFGISFAVNVFTHDECPEEHRRLVDEWRAATHEFPSIDIWLPVAGEDLAILENSWSHVSRLRWGRALRVLVGDDAASPAVQAAAERFGFQYRTRADRGWMKKAGNLRDLYENSDGSFALILDADFTPRPDMLYELMPYFDNEEVGIVQSPQHFRVLREQNWLERGAGAVQELFYRAIQVSRQAHDGAVCVGTNAIYRRRALDDNNGTTLIGHSEDVHTGFDLRRFGWLLRYVPVVLATGLCPDSLNCFMRQQYRWCMGSMSLLSSRKFWKTKMPLKTRCCYLAGFGYYLSTALNVLLFPVLPIILLTCYPEMIHLSNYIILAPALLYMYVGFPIWHRCKWGLEAWSVQMLYSWSHCFALFDILRRRPMGWTPTGAAEGSELRSRIFRGTLLVWSGGMALTWVCLALMRWTETNHSVSFIPLIFIGTFYLLVVIQTFIPVERNAK